MLVLTRKAGEAVRIAGAVTVRVVKLEGNKVRLAIDAPADLAIRRMELVVEEGVAEPPRRGGCSGPGRRLETRRRAGAAA